MAEEVETTAPSEVMEEEAGYEGGEEGGATTAFSGLSEMMGGEEAEEEGEEISRMGDSSDNPEQKRRYMEYLGLIKEIDCQNRMIEDIKIKINERCAKTCKTREEMKQIKAMRTCMEQENLKLQCLMSKAMELQNFGSRRRYPGIPIATTIDEDNLAPYVGCSFGSPAWKAEDKGKESDKSTGEDEDDVCGDPCQKDTRDKDKEKEKQLRCVCKALAKMKVCPEDKKLIKEIAATLLCDSIKKKKESEKPCSPCGRQKKKEKVCHKKKEPPVCKPPPSENLGKLKQQIACMQLSVNQLREEIVQRECKQQQQQQQEVHLKEEPDALLCSSKRETKSDQIEKLKENYLYLLAEYAKKDCQLKEMEMRMKGFCGGCNGKKNGKNANDTDDSELELLRGRVNELKEEQVEFKCIMKEQSQQLEDYRNKYLTAQQKVEEQTATLDKLNMNNKRIEKQINAEVKEIRAKFQDKLNELLHFPKLLENEQLKLAAACKEKEDLQSKLQVVCKELQALKAQIEDPAETHDCRPQLARAQQDLATAQKKIEDLEKQRDMFCEQLKTTQEDLDTLRTESAKIIARTKERTELLRQQLQEQVNRLEKELAKCRATACLSVNDREAVIREMQGQLNTLAYSFDAAQKQIKTLRNHIAYVSNENCFPIKC